MWSGALSSLVVEDFTSCANLRSQSTSHLMREQKVEAHAGARGQVRPCGGARRATYRPTWSSRLAKSTKHTVCTSHFAPAAILGFVRIDQLPILPFFSRRGRGGGNAPEGYETGYTTAKSSISLVASKVESVAYPKSVAFMNTATLKLCSSNEESRCFGKRSINRK